MLSFDGAGHTPPRGVALPEASSRCRAVHPIKVHSGRGRFIAQPGLSEEALQRWLVTLVAALGAALALPGAAVACSTDDKAYFDAFPDANCLLAGYTNIETDTLGGLRLKTNGRPVTASWDTRAELEDGLTYQGELFAPVDRSTLEVVGAADATAALELPKTTMPLTPRATRSLAPTASTWLDSDGVRDPSVIKEGSQYVMYYTGLAEDGTGPAIFRLVSTAGTTTWTRPADPAQRQPILSGTAGAFDERGVYGADVVYDPGDAEAPYKMWYSGAGDTFDQIGYATSGDGIAWTKHDGDDADAPARPRGGGRPAGFRRTPSPLPTRRSCSTAGCGRCTTRATTRRRSRSPTPPRRTA